MGSLTDIAGTRVYLDANIFIYQFEGDAPTQAKLFPLFAQFDSGSLHAVSSELSLAEVLVSPLRKRAAAEVARYRQALRTSTALTIFPVSREILIAAAQIRADYRAIKLPDAIHAATALLNGTFLTNDTRFAVIRDLPILHLSTLP